MYNHRNESLPPEWCIRAKESYRGTVSCGRGYVLIPELTSFARICAVSTGSIPCYNYPLFAQWRDLFSSVSAIKFFQKPLQVGVQPIYMADKDFELNSHFRNLLEFSNAVNPLGEHDQHLHIYFGTDGQMMLRINGQDLNTSPPDVFAAFVKLIFFSQLRSPNGFNPVDYCTMRGYSHTNPLTSVNRDFEEIKKRLGLGFRLEALGSLRKIQGAHWTFGLSDEAIRQWNDNHKKRNSL